MPAKTTALVVNGIAHPNSWKIYLPRIPLRPIRDSKAMPATVGGNTIGASTNGLMKLANFPELFAKIHASGTPRIRDVSAARVDVQRESFMAVSSDIEVKKEVQGTFAIKAINGAMITTLASAASALTVFPNFTLFQILCPAIALAQL
jgi:hypothetical protein